MVLALMALIVNYIVNEYAYAINHGATAIGEGMYTITHCGNYLYKQLITAT